MQTDSQTTEFTPTALPALPHRLTCGPLRTSSCPACASHVAVPFLEEQHQPLATVNWPRTCAEATSMKSLPLAFMRCVQCGHVYNMKFRYDEVPYSRKPNLMFNQGSGWSRHIQSINDLLVEHLPEDPTVVEIGCGDGHLLRSLSSRLRKGRYVGFDPHARFCREGRVEFRGELFVPEQHLNQLQPDLLVCRHVLEHLESPLAFLETIGVAAAWSGRATWLFAEVPCIDRVFESGRTVDFYYEHNSHFTTKSFSTMLQRSGGHVEMLARFFHDEVLCGVVRFAKSPETVELAEAAIRFREHAHQAKLRICDQLHQLVAQGSRLAVWGGTGKAAAFMNYYGVDADRFPLVVDSDPDKCGTFVPGTGQEIRFRDALLTTPVEIIVIPMQWRAQDIVQEMEQVGIVCRQVLIEHRGRLVDYYAGAHPY